MEPLRRWMAREGQSRSRSTATLLALLLLALLWPTATPPQEWLKGQAIGLLAFALTFHLGALLQAWRSHRAVVANQSKPADLALHSPGSPALVSGAPPMEMEYVSPALAHERSVLAVAHALPMPTHPLTPPPAFSLHRGTMEIRAYANTDDAVAHGWSFCDPIGSLAGQPVLREARFQGAVYEFNGLLPSALSSVVPPHLRAFGRLCYRLRPLVQPLAEPASA